MFGLQFCSGKQPILGALGGGLKRNVTPSIFFANLLHILLDQNMFKKEHLETSGLDFTAILIFWPLFFATFVSKSKLGFTL